MYDPQMDKAMKLMSDTCDKYHGRMNSCVLEWETISLSHPRYEGKIDQLVPLVVIDWK